jgi:YHS domain-containing protein
MGSLKPSTRIDESMVADPVCGMDVPTENAGFIVCYQGTSYYFCAEACRRAFEKNPKKYLKSGSSKRKGVWGRYLDRLNKATNGQSIKCH